MLRVLGEFVLPIVILIYVDETSLILSTNHVQIGLFIVESDLGGGNLMQGGRGIHLMMDSKMELIVLPICYHCNSKSCNGLHASSKLVVVWFM